MATLSSCFLWMIKKGQAPNSWLYLFLNLLFCQLKLEMVLAILLQTLLVLWSSLLLQTMQGWSGLALLWKTCSKGLSGGFAVKKTFVWGSHGHSVQSRDVALPKGLPCGRNTELLVGLDFLWHFYEIKSSSWQTLMYLQRNYKAWLAFISPFQPVLALVGSVRGAAWLVALNDTSRRFPDNN